MKPGLSLVGVGGELSGGVVEEGEEEFGTIETFKALEAECADSL